MPANVAGYLVGVAVIRYLINLGAICLVSALAACASIPPQQSSIQHVAGRDFVINEEKYSAVGASMIQVNDYWVEKGGYGNWRAPASFSVAYGLARLEFTGGASYPVIGRRTIDGQDYDILGGFLDPVYVDQSGRVAKIGASIGPLTANLKDQGERLVKADSVRVVQTLPFAKFELVYSGISANTIRVSYREYSRDDLARTAFFQELTYNTDDASITFRDIQLEVIEATNNGIRFKVLKAP